MAIDTAPGLSPWTHSDCRVDRDRRAVGRVDLTGDDQPDGPRGDRLGVVQHRPGLGPGHEGAGCRVGAVGEGLGHGREAGSLGERAAAPNPGRPSTGSVGSTRRTASTTAAAWASWCTTAL